MAAGTCTDETGFQDALVALNWQLEQCDRDHPGLPWIAVIHRENKYVKLLNDYVGFQEINEDHPYFDATARAFKGAPPEDFFYVIREPNPKAEARPS